jgi:hypothetical protein
MGLRVQLGHNPGTPCCRPKAAFGDDFVVIDVHRIHEISLDFCGCEHEVSHFKQLLRARWFPSTITDPRTAATFAILEFFHLLSFESKVSAYEFYHCLARRTDNTGITPIRVSPPPSHSLSYAHHSSGSLSRVPPNGCRVEKQQIIETFRMWT